MRNIEANPRVRIRVSGQPWRAGTAHILDDDDARERQRVLGRAGLARGFCFYTAAAFTTHPLTVRVDLDAP